MCDQAPTPLLNGEAKACSCDQTNLADLKRCASINAKREMALQRLGEVLAETRVIDGRQLSAVNDIGRAGMQVPGMDIACTPFQSTC